MLFKVRMGDKFDAFTKFIKYWSLEVWIKNRETWLWLECKNYDKFINF